MTTTSGGRSTVGHRMAFLDVIRGLAALSVVLEHGSERFFPGYLKWANSYFTLGVFGVATFFLVSGFIIPVSMERHSSLWEFWMARFFRLYPMYWFSLLLPVLLLLNSNRLSSLGPHPWRMVLANATMLQTFLGVPNVSGLYWTLTMELIFYLLCSCVFLMGALSRSLLWLWTAVLSNLVGNLLFAVTLHRSLPAGRTALLISACLGTVVYRKYHGSISTSQIVRVLPVLVLSLCVGFWFRFQAIPSSLEDGAFRFLGVTLSYTGAYLLFFGLYRLRKIRFPHALVWLGRISYSMYLIHGYALGLVPLGSYPLLRLALCVIIAIAFSITTHFLIEQPGLALYRRISQSRSLKSLTFGAVSELTPQVARAARVD